MASEAVTTHNEKENVFQPFFERVWGMLVRVCLRN